MALSRNSVKMGANKVFNTETIYAKAMGLQSSSHSLDTATLLAHEFAPLPMSMFESNGRMPDSQPS